MNQKDITSFKRFLQNHGMNTMFAGFYNQFKYDDNPETVQQFLELVPRNLAIAYSFDVTKIKAQNYGAKYWNDLNEKWRNFINKTDERKAFEEPGIEREEKVVKREKKAIEPLNPIVNGAAPESETRIVANDWAGLDLVSVNANVQKQMPMPNENEIRVNTKNKSVVVLNSTIVKLIEDAGFDSMSIQVDRITNSMVWVFGKGLQFNITKYSKDVQAIQYTAVVDYLEKYLDRTLDPEKYYYIRIAQRMWNSSHTAYAIVLSQKFTTKDR